MILIHIHHIGMMLQFGWHVCVEQCLNSKDKNILQNFVGFFPKNTFSHYVPLKEKSNTIFFKWPY